MPRIRSAGGGSTWKRRPRTNSAIAIPAEDAVIRGFRPTLSMTHRATMVQRKMTCPDHHVGPDGRRVALSADLLFEDQGAVVDDGVDPGDLLEDREEEGDDQGLSEPVFEQVPEGPGFLGDRLADLPQPAWAAWARSAV